MDIAAAERDWWSRVGQLWGKATGGGDVAARPIGEESFWPTVASAPGVEEAAEWLRRGLTGSDTPRMLFLVGGPGAGKSHALASIVAGLVPISSQDDGLAHRSYTYQTEQGVLQVINDATIPPGQGGSLASDVTLALREGRHLVACVNRGVLVEETNQIRVPETAGEALVLRLVRSASAEPAGIDIVEHQGSYVASGTIRDVSGSTAHVMIVFVDVCSLFERRPSVLISEAVGGPPEVEAQVYRIRKLTARSGIDEASMPGGALLAEIVKALADPDSAIPLNPVEANVASLSSASVRASVLTILRSSEIVAGGRMTFREAWGAFARALVGDLTVGTAADQIRQSLADMQPVSDAPSDRWSALQSLAGVRLSQSLFGIPVGQLRASASDPVIAFTREIDPVRDARPGHFVDSEPDCGWVTPVLDAFSGLVTAESPLHALLRNLSGASPMHQMVTEFDRELDAAFTAATGSDHLADRPRAEAIAWYGDYLARMFAVAHGIPAFRHEIAMWTLAWSVAPNIPSALEGNLRTLLRPRRDPDDPHSSVLLPVFASRTTPITGREQTPRLAIRGADVALATSRSGDRLTLKMLEEAKPVGTIELDFPIVREALTCSHGHVGITDLSSVASPRLERFRAARLVPARLAHSQLRVLVGDIESVVTLEGLE